MKLSPTYRAPFKRRRLGKTDYQKRLKLLLSKKPRFVVRRSLRYIIAQIVEFDKKGDKTILSANSRQLKKLGWSFPCDNLPAAYLTGLALGKQATKNKITEVVLDSGLYSSTKGNRIYAAVKGALDAGLKVPCSEEILPTEDRFSGKHIQKFKDLHTTFQHLKKKISGE